MSLYTNLLARLKREKQALFIALAALAIGLSVGLLTVGFIQAIAAIQDLFFGTNSMYLARHLRAEAQWWQIFLVPMIGGLAVGLLTQYFMPASRPQGIADVIEANALKSGYMSSWVGLKSIALSALSLGSGASVGREGPMVHFGAAVGSLSARRLGLARHHARMLLSCGVAAAVAASFNAPLAGVFFALEVVVGHYGFAAFAPVILSAVAATGVCRYFLGNDPAFEVPSQTIATVLEGPAFILLGLAGGFFAVLLCYGARFARHSFARSKLPIFVRPALAGLVLGTVAIWLPEVLGVGYQGTDLALQGKLAFFTAFALLLVKLCMTCLCLGAGFSGGVFSPALFIGAMLGTCFGQIAIFFAPVEASQVPVYTMVGMAAVAAPVMGSPISSILMIFEITGEYSLLLAVMAAVVSASFVAHMFDVSSFFSLQLEDRGVLVKDGHDVAVLRSITVEQIMDRDVGIVSPTTSGEALKEGLLASNWGRLCVVDDDRHLVGIVSLALDSTRISLEPDVTALDLAHEVPTLLPTDTLEKAMQVLRQTKEAHIPVVAVDGSKLIVGQVHEHDLNAAYHEALLTHEGAEELDRVILSPKA